MTQPVGVVLAAGLARRMGRPKQLLEYGDTTVLGSVLAATAASRLPRTVLVVGAYADEILAAVDVSAVEVVHNPQPERGNLSSLLIAADAAGEAPLLLLMGDMPGVEGDVIDAHLEAWERAPAWMRITQYCDGRGHPFMLSPELVAGLSALGGARPLWSLVPRADVLEVAAAMPVDVNTPDDYDAALARRSSSQ